MTFIPIILRSIFHAYCTGTIYFFLQKKYAFNRWLFIIIVFITAALLEIREHLIKIPNDPFLTRDSILFGLILLINIIFIITRPEPSQLANLYLFTTLLLILLTIAIDFFFKTGGIHHREYKHFVDIAAYVLGPLVITPLIKILIK